MKIGTWLFALAAASAIHAQTLIESFEYPSTEDLTAAWFGSANTTVTTSDSVAPLSTGLTSMQVKFDFPSGANATETINGPELATPISIAPGQYLSFRVKGDPAFRSADFRNLYLYAYDADGGFGRWGAAVPVVGSWQIFNFLASTIEQPWNSTALPDLSRIVRFAFYQYGSAGVIPAYTATIQLDDVTLRDTPLDEPPTSQESVVETFEYAATEELAAVWKPSVNAAVSLSDAVSTGSSGTNAMKVEFHFPSTANATETVTGPVLANPVPIAPSQYVSFRVKGDPAFGGSDFHNLYLYAYDASGNFGRWGAAVPITATWQVFNFKADTIDKPWDSPALPTLGQIVKFAFFQYGSEGAIPAYSATIFLDDLEVRDTPQIEPPPIQEAVIADFEYPSEEELQTAWVGSANTAVSASTEVAPHSTGLTALKLDFNFPSTIWATESVSGPTLPTPIAIGPAQYVSLRIKGDPAFAAADFRNLYLYAYDANGNSGRWGAEVPATADWKIFNFPATPVDRPWDSPGPLDLNQIVRFAFFQYGSQAAIEAYSASIQIDDVVVRNTPLTEFPAPAPARLLIEDFEGFADGTALTSFYSYLNSSVETVTTASLETPAPQGNKALRLAVDFASGQYPWGSIRSTAVAPFSFPTNAVLSFRFKGDPSLATTSDAGTSFWLSFYDSTGRAISYISAPTPVTSSEWTPIQAGLSAFGDTAAVDIGNLVQWRILVQGWQGTPDHAAQSGVFYVDDIQITVPPALEVSGTPPAGLSGTPFTDIVVNEANRVVSAAIPAAGTAGFLTITPAQNITSVTVEDGRLVVRW